MRIFALTILMSLALAPAVARAGAWPEHVAKLSKLKGEVDALESEVKHMIHEKRESHVESEVRELTLSIAKQYKKLQEVSKELEDETAHIRFKHPEQAETLERKYSRFKLKSLDDLASESGIDGRLDRIKRKVAQTFPNAEQVRQAVNPPRISPLLRMPASVDADTEDADLERITLKK